jgi:hypothetical protein
MGADRTRTLHGALAGGVAAAAWAAQMPLDKRVFGVGCDDVELLGGRPLGLLLHVSNGALFGAVYSVAAPALPGPAWLRGPVAALAEHVATWPAAVLLARRRRVPAEWDSRAAFAQSAWRHLLFGAVLGELERRLNAPRLGPVDEEAVASNGHGSVERVVAVR